MFFSSHIIDVVERICDKIAIIRKGQIQCVRDVADIEEKEESLEAFYMSVINGREVEPIAVGKDISESDAEAKHVKKKLFKKKSSSDKENDK